MKSRGEEKSALELTGLVNIMNLFKYAAVGEIGIPKFAAYVDSASGLIFCRMAPYENECIRERFKPEQFKGTTQMLDNYFGPLVQSRLANVVKKLDSGEDIGMTLHREEDYKGTTVRYGLGTKDEATGVSLYVLPPTAHERQTAVIPVVGDDVFALPKLAADLVTVKAWKDRACITSFLSRGNFYPIVGDWGDILTASYVDPRKQGGTHHPYPLETMLAFFRSPKGTPPGAFLHGL